MGVLPDNITERPPSGRAHLGLRLKSVTGHPPLSNVYQLCSAAIRGEVGRSWLQRPWL